MDDSSTRTLGFDQQRGSARTFNSYTLTVLDGPDAGAVVGIEATSPSGVFVGTSAACELVLNDRSVSRRHASFEVVPSGVRVADVGSKNGVFLGAVRLVEAVLVGGEVLRVGETTLKLTRLEGAVTAPLSPAASFGKLLGASDEMRRLYPLLTRLSASDVGVLIEGETGTGKEVLAESLHDASKRRAGPFVVFDCTTVAATLMEATLFGHEKGAFTGAVSARPGVFELADRGTLFLDEIGDLDLSLQPKLLRAVQQSQVQRVGAATWRTVNVRIIAATRRDLEKEVQAGRFRDDLYFRLAVARVALPPLRRRRGDIRALAEHFARQMGEANGRLTEEALARFEDYAWPGNVRELWNAVSRHLALGELADLTPLTRALEESASPHEDPIEEILALNLKLPEARERVVREFERRYLQRVLDASGGNVTKAAKEAGIARRYFYTLSTRSSGG